jgi:4-aminobutyrate aminotransferase
MGNNARLATRRSESISRGVGVTTQIYADRAENAEIWDVEGKRYIDFAAGIAVVNTGHRHPRVIDAVKKQLDRFTHTCHQVVPYENYVELAERLNKAVLGNFAKKTIFVSTGAEAVENAIKIARAATGRSAVIAFSGAFHGRTFMGMTLTGKVQPCFLSALAMPLIVSLLVPLAIEVAYHVLRFVLRIIRTIGECQRMVKYNMSINKPYNSYA